jgi:uncharacterized protein YbaA (DUF1428 family)
MIRNEEVSMRYVDGFVVPVRKNRLDEYRKIARKAGKIWKEHGALEYVECVAEDVKKGKVTSFPQSVQLKRAETVVFSYIVYKSRKHRDRVLAKVMEDSRLADMMKSKKMPFDPERMFWGGFADLVRL